MFSWYCVSLLLVASLAHIAIVVEYSSAGNRKLQVRSNVSPTTAVSNTICCHPDVMSPDRGLNVGLLGIWPVPNVAMMLMLATPSGTTSVVLRRKVALMRLPMLIGIERVDVEMVTLLMTVE